MRHRIATDITRTKLQIEKILEKQLAVSPIRQQIISTVREAGPKGLAFPNSQLVISNQNNLWPVVWLPVSQGQLANNIKDNDKKPDENIRR
ncbi:hypothetical protein TRICI_004872 [Trichomonascus ciferrii]|uniref:Uncharacterized protein n=1 Tax=Trichomonascus ciferrii TaxID=44093 RepID=A0A642UYU8_9ASCO|nr:hypothetical protein TRICI_004872 [Trichomonascus ciferrii]